MYYYIAFKAKIMFRFFSSEFTASYYHILNILVVVLPITRINGQNSWIIINPQSARFCWQIPAFGGKYVDP